MELFISRALICLTMGMKRFLLIIVCAISVCTYAKDIVIDFNDPTAFYERYVFTKGIEGKAIDLSSAAYHRNPVTISEVDSVDMSRTFSMGIWVKASSSNQGVRGIVGNKKSFDGRDAGFLLSTQANGSWAVHFTDGKNWQWDYQPTVARQPVTDGKWHFLAVTFDSDRQEMKMYYDGMLVAIYCTNGNKHLGSSSALYVGNYVDDQWHSFEGCLDRFTFTDRIKTEAEIADEFYAYTGVRHESHLDKFTSELNLMAFNIYHGGHELGENVGVQRVVDVIKASGADVVGMIETYGAGAEIADALGYYLYLRSSNLSILSKYPIEQTWDMFQPFNTCAATIRISQTQTFNYVNLWLDYLPSTDEQVRTGVSVEEMIKQEGPTRLRELKCILNDMKPFLDQKDTPLFVSGDFNSGSHLDWTEKAKSLFQGCVFPWPTSVLMEQYGFKDSYRELYPNELEYPCLTWSTMSKLDIQYRIDFIYYKGKKVKAIHSEMIDKHPVRFPSDHAAMLTTFKFKK